MFKRITTKDKAQFLRKLSSMIGAGIPLLRALEIISGEKLKVVLKGEIDKVIQSVKEGVPLSSALKDSKLNDSFYEVICVSEENGRLAEALCSVSRYLEEKEATRRKVISSLIYPSLVLTLSFLSVALLLTVILPVFSSMYRDLEVPLPLITTYLISFSDLISSYWFLFSMFFLITLASAYVYLNKKKAQEIFELMKYRAPLLGGIFQKVTLSKTLKALGSLLSSGLPITSALKTCAASSGCGFYREKYLLILADMEMGEKLSSSIEKAGCFPSEVVQLVSAGEESGALAEMLIHLGEYFEREVEYAIKSATSLIEPLSTLIVGAIVGIIVIAMFLPLVNLMSVLQQ
ncbi:MAG: type II secretion system F family protein [Candidatus Saganbacteria bacterium]|nr:type II secretion system F family protein [Candidatus Saganbacteria bacterium]